jgi:hypothetical protein
VYGDAPDLAAGNLALAGVQARPYLQSQPLGAGGNGAGAPDAATPAQRVVYTNQAVLPLGPFSQAVWAGRVPLSPALEDDLVRIQDRAPSGRGRAKELFTAAANGDER